jgi:Big-like domain-containing protein
VVTYTPTVGYSGQDTFAYTVTDNQGSVSAPAQVTVTVTPAVTVSTGDPGSKGGGGGGSIGIMDIAVLMALLQIGAWRQRLRRPRDVARGHRFRERTDAGGDILQR